MPHKYSPPCSVPGCVDLNLKLADAIEQAGFPHLHEHLTLERKRDLSRTHDAFTTFVLAGNVQQIPCGCEIRGGGNCVSPLHIHYCAKHSGEPAVAFERRGPMIYTEAEPGKAEHVASLITAEDAEAAVQKLNQLVGWK